MEKLITVVIQEGSLSNIFRDTLVLGMEHIKDGNDYLLFLLVLLLPLPLLRSGTEWGAYGGIKFSLLRILKVVAAFSIGHSVTLLIGAAGMLHFSERFVDILIAVSIIISAFHAIRPVFTARELYIAAGFGLIHGMAFTATLAGFNPGGGNMALSVFGFSLGIELMQFFVIALTVPWLIILSSRNRYTNLRVNAAIAAIVASFGWIVQMITGEPNMAMEIVQGLAAYSWVLILLLALAAVWSAANRNALPVQDVCQFDGIKVDQE